MLDTKLIVGRYITMSPETKAALHYNPHVAANFVSYANQNSRNVYLRESSTSGNMTISPVVDGTHTTKPHRNFKWLPWHAGMISYTNLDRDVLTGPMSGCNVTVYIEGTGNESGVVKVGHVGTMERGAPATNAVKQHWNQFAALPSTVVLGGFNPARALNPPAALTATDIATEVWGLVTMDRLYFTIQVFMQRSDRNCYRIGRVIPALSLSQAELLAL